jgi:dienelactone hydrolase
MQMSSRPPPSREIVLFHSVLGLRPAVRGWADRLRQVGHVVHMPDLYGGRVFDDIGQAMREVESIGGIDAIVARTYEAVDGLPSDVVYAGFSNGGGSAQLLALTRPGALGAVLMHAALPVEAFGVSAWPADVPVQIHYAVADPFREAAAVAALQQSVRDAGASCELFDYPGSGHLFADPELEEYEPASAELMFRRVSGFLEQLPGRD